MSALLDSPSAASAASSIPTSQAGPSGQPRAADSRAAQVHDSAARLLLSGAAPNEGRIEDLAANSAAFETRLAALSQALAQGAAETDRTAAFPFQNFARLQREDLVAAVVPAWAGGGGASLATASRIIGAVGRAESSTALVLTMTYLVHRALARGNSRWPTVLRDEVWRSAVRDGALANNLRVEPALGSPSRGGVPQTHAQRTATGWSLSGHKQYCTGVPGLRWLLVHARTDGALPDVGTFLVPRDLPGIRVIETWDSLGLRASGSHEVVFDEVQIPFDHAVDLRPPADWAGPDPDQSAWMAVLLSSLYDGVARAARDWLHHFLHTRAPANLGRPLATLPRMQQAAGEIESLLDSNRLTLAQLAAASDAGEAIATARSGLVKYRVTNQAIRVVDIALELTGNHGLSRRNPLERHHRDVLCSRIHTPQDDTTLTGAGRAALEASTPAQAA